MRRCSSDSADWTDRPSRSLVQKKFGHRRSIAKPRLSMLKKKRGQSTLTQLDFVCTPSTNRELDVFDSEGEKDCEEPRPRKRQRRKAKTDEDDPAKRNTLTQIGFLGSGNRPHAEADDEQHDSYAQDSVGGFLGAINHLTQSQTQVSQPILEIPESDNIGIGHVGADEDHPMWSEGLGVFSRISSLDKTTSAFITPKKRRRIEAPSSQTPPSIKQSAQSSRRSVTKSVVERSPLKQRSANAALSPCRRSSPAKLTIASQELKSASFKVPLNDGQEENQAPLSTNSESCLANRITRAHRRPRKLRRTATVEDSQTEDLDISCETFRSVPHSGPPTEKLKDHTDGRMQIYEDPKDDECDEQFTYDPANAALDRDAARFGWTQLDQSRFVHSVSHRRDHEDHDDILDNSSAENLLQADSVVGSAISTNTPKATNQTPATSDSAPPLDDTVQIIPSSQVNLLPSSPPLRPSQISTVVPTQNFHHLSADDAFRGMACSQQGHGNAPNMAPNATEVDVQVPSSPLPLPPWGSLKSHNGDGVEYGVARKADRNGTQEWESLADFSLPPPPPMSWRSSQASTQRQ